MKGRRVGGGGFGPGGGGLLLTLFTSASVGSRDGDSDRAGAGAGNCLNPTASPQLLRLPPTSHTHTPTPFACVRRGALKGTGIRTNRHRTHHLAKAGSWSPEKGAMGGTGE